jgi:RNA polymerase sigma-70 factor (ECF subfamily)
MSTTLDSGTRASVLLRAGNPANQEARAAFAERYAPLIRDWCRPQGLQQADEDDVTQSILCRLFEMLPRFQYDRRKGRFRDYVRKMVDNAIMDIYRKHRKPGIRGTGDPGVEDQLQEVPFRPCAPDDASVEDLVQKLAGQMERDQQLQAACERVRQRVEPNTWQVFWLTTVEDRSAEEVARQLGMPKGRVYVYRNRVTKMIRSEVKDAAGREERGAHRLGSP